MIASRRSPATLGRSVTTNGSARPASKNAASAGLARTSARTASRTASACAGVAVMTASDSSGRSERVGQDELDDVLDLLARRVD